MVSGDTSRVCWDSCFEQMLV